MKSAAWLVSNGLCGIESVNHVADQVWKRKNWWFLTTSTILTLFESPWKWYTTPLQHLSWILLVTDVRGSAVVWLALAWAGVVWAGLAWYGLAWYGLGWLGRGLTAIERSWQYIVPSFLPRIRNISGFWIRVNLELKIWLWKLLTCTDSQSTYWCQIFFYEKLCSSSVKTKILVIG